MSKLRYKTEKLVIKDFSKTKLKAKAITEFPDCVNIYNISNHTGVLSGGTGVGDFVVHYSNDPTSWTYSLDFDALNIDGINKVMYFKQYFESGDETVHRLLFHCSDGKVYIYQLFCGSDTPSWLYDLQFESEPIVLAYKKDGLDCVLLSANDKLVVWKTSQTPYEITGVPTITSMCIYNDVLYCTIAGNVDRIWYSESLDPEDIGTESAQTKYISLKTGGGGGRKIVNLKENMYVFCDYSIGRINTYVKDEPTYNEIYQCNAQIYPNTVTVCGDIVMFVAGENLYRFNGTSVDKVDALYNLLKNGNFDFATATIMEDNYYLAAKIDFADNRSIGWESNYYSDMKNNALIRLNLNDYSFEILRGVDIKNILALNAGVENKLVLTFNSVATYKVGELRESRWIFQSLLNGAYETNYVTQPDFEKITIRKIKVDAAKDVQITINTDQGDKTIITKCDGISEFNVCMPCQKFQLRVLLSSNNSLYINLMEIEYTKIIK